MFGYFPDQGTEKARAFLNTASLVDDQVFAIVTDEKVIEELEAEAENVVLYKNVSFIFLNSGTPNAVMSMSGHGFSKKNHNIIIYYIVFLIYITTLGKLEVSPLLNVREYLNCQILFIFLWYYCYGII